MLAENENEDGAATETTMRIFVGGLGENVKEEDMEHIFKASLGKVEAIDFIRTKGRSFAYLDFVPSSPKSLPKLFSIYNGCVWKGGKLKLEKAKESYLVRLKREWEEDAQHAHVAPISDVADKTTVPSVPSLKNILKSDKAQLQIFFPKLQKVKSLPFSGTGKHKYSFQRVEEPPLPINFCDCEEHYVSPETAKEKQARAHAEKQSGGINEEELSLMKSVMNKLFEKEKNSKAASSQDVLVIEEESNEHEEATEEEDEDNLIINMVTKVGKRTTSSRAQENAPTEYQFDDTHESKLKKLEVSKAKPIRDTRSEVVSSLNKKKKLTINNTKDNGSEPKSDKWVKSDFHESKSNPSWSQKSSWKKLVSDEGKGNTAFSISHVLSGTASTEEEEEQIQGDDGSVESEEDLAYTEGKLDQSKELESSNMADGNDIKKASGRGAFWLQKSSWTQLVSDTNNTSFSISHIVPDIAFKETVPKSNESVDAPINKCELAENVGDDDDNMKRSIELGGVVNSNDEVVSLASKRGGAPSVGVGVCSFMRSAKSLKNWANTKAVLTKKRKHHAMQQPK